MRQLLLFSLVFIISQVSFAQFSINKVPDPMEQGHGYVSNPDHIISEATTAELNSRLKTLDENGTAQVAIVLLHTIGDQVPKDIAHALFRKWRPGEKGKNNGLVLLLVEDQHRVEIETGYGLEGNLPDVVAFRIEQEHMVPYFKQHQYDEGILEGVQAVANTLQHAGDSTFTEEVQPFVPAAPERGTPGEESFFLYIFYAVATAFMFWKKKPVIKQTGPIVLYKPGLFVKILVFAAPFIIMLVLNFVVQYDFHWWTMPFIFYITWLIYLLYATLRIQLRARKVLKNSSRKVQYETWLATHKYGLVTALLFPIPFLAYYRFHKFRLHRLRYTPYACETCKTTMTLTENPSQYLSQAQQLEEKLGSIGYDVWTCANGHQEVLAYEHDTTQISRCPQCANKTLKAGKKETVVAATTSRKGRGQQYFNCPFCHFKQTIPYVIPMLSSSSSSSSSSGSSSSSDSGGGWGGGDSGGGGAGSSW